MDVYGRVHTKCPPPVAVKQSGVRPRCRDSNPSLPWSIFQGSWGEGRESHTLFFRERRSRYVFLPISISGNPFHLSTPHWQPSPLSMFRWVTKAPPTRLPHWNIQCRSRKLQSARRKPCRSATVGIHLSELCNLERSTWADLEKSQQHYSVVCAIEWMKPSYNHVIHKNNSVMLNIAWLQ